MTNITRTKEYVFISELLIHHHPAFKNNPAAIAWALAYPHFINITTMTEDVLATHSEGLYTLVNNHSHDFSDGSDAKTGTVIFDDKCDRSKTVIIKNVEHKIGALRIVVFNGHKPVGNQLDYFYIPETAVKKMWEKDGTDSKKRIRSNWNERNGYSKWNNYRLNSFLDLAKKI